ncbi:diacylglycerol/lipid kinase family protein [Sphingomonas sp. CJ99]
MERLWFVTNPGSGTTSAEKCEAIVAVFAERGLTLVGRTDFPEQPMPTPEQLDGERVDTLVLFAGDGTINTALCALHDWEGAFLILPGGTMNLLAKALHDSLDPAEIIHAAHVSARRVALPWVDTDVGRAFVGLILGPAGQWYRAREGARRGKFGQMFAAIRYAWRRTFGRGIRVRGVVGMTGSYQAVFVRPDMDGLDVAAIDARDWRAILDLGWNWLTGEWVSARPVTQQIVRDMRVAGRKPVLALFDGEPQPLPPGAPIRWALSKERFVATRAVDEVA